MQNLGVRRVGVLLAASLVACGVVAAAHPNPSLGASASPPVRPIVTGWLPYWQSSTATSTVTSNADLFNEASPFVWSTSSAKGVTLQGSASSLSTMVAALHARGIAVIPTFTTTMNADRFAALLSDPVQRREHVRALVSAARAFGVDGVDLDYENINFGSSSARQVVKSLYPRLVSALDRALNNKGMVSAVTVPARRSDSDPNWAVYDYAALGAAADRFRIMTYDYSWGGGPPGPIAPKSWVNAVLAYSVTRVSPAKISFGLPSYGRDWFVGTVKGSCTAANRASLSRTSAQMTAFAQARSIKPSWSASATSRTFSYRQRYTNQSGTCVAKRQAWYDDARAFRAKLPLVAKYHLRGVAIWAIGNETPGMWTTMRNYARTVTKRGVAITMKAPTRVTYGTSARLTGRARLSNGQAAPGVRIALVRRAVGGTWRVVTSKTSDANGRVHFAVSPHQRAQYRLHSASSWLYRAGNSVTKSTRVAYRVDLGAPSARLSVASRQFTVTGTISPAQTGVVVRLQVASGSGWVNRRSSTVGATGAFSLPLRVKQAGVREVRVIAEPASLDRGASSTVRLRFH